MLLLSAVLWFSQPAPLQMPRAEAYQVKDTAGRLWLEDRYNELDLWTSNAVLARWKDMDGRQLTVAKLAVTAPLTASATITRESFHNNAEPLPVKRTDLRDQAIAWLSPFELPEDPVSPRQDVHGFDKVQYLHGTNETAVVCAFRPEKSVAWYLAVWELLPDDDFSDAVAIFESDFLAAWEERVREGLRSETDWQSAPKPRRSNRRARLEERSLLRAACVHSVTNYPNWHVTSADEYVILDDLPNDNAAVTTITNELTQMRAKYAAVFPSPINGSNVLAVARLFKNEDEYRAALTDNDLSGGFLDQSAAYWCPARRELVAYLPPGGARDLLKTFRHEAFHQFLSYACSMIPVSTWLNEGYAQYFEDENDADWKIEVDLEQAARYLPALLGMDAASFYDLDPTVSLFHYRLAWSIAYFLEKGAPKVRFEPFKDLKEKYVTSLLRHHDAERATAEAFGSEEQLKKFVAEWKKFWEAL